MWYRISIILIIIILAEYYSYTLVSSITKQLQSNIKITIIVAYLFITVLSWLGFYFARFIHAGSSPNLVRNVFTGIIFGFFIGKVVIMLFMFVDDIRRIITWVGMLLFAKQNIEIGESRNIERSVFIQQISLVLAGFALFGFGWGTKNKYKYRIRRIKINIAGLPEIFKGFKIVQLSDIHIGSFDSYTEVEKGIRLVLDQKPDVICFTGDLVNSVATEIDDKFKNIFSQLKAPYGVLSILGNHDYGDYAVWESEDAKAANLNKLKAIQAEMGWRLLMNEHVEIEKENSRLAIIGIENWSAKAHFPKYGNMKKACEGLSGKNIAAKILLSHDPSHWDEEVTKNYKDINLTLSGHTHGMQFGIESKFFKWSPVQYVYSKWAGIYGEGAQNLYVNRGFGFIGYPGRLGIMPEISVIELA